MDIVTFTAMLHNAGLFFVRADKLGDPFEGSFPRANGPVRIQRWMERVPVDAPPELWTQLTTEISERARRTRNRYLINCWHMNDHESAAMWSVYGGRGHSIAIQSTYSRLCEVLPADSHVGVVQYIDYGHDEIPEWNGFTPYLHKRASYRYETEVRAITKYTRDQGAMPIMLPEVGMWVSTQLGELIESVHVAPDSAEWVKDLVSNLVDRYGFAFPVHRSKLDEEPFY